MMNFNSLALPPTLPLVVLPPSTRDTSLNSLVAILSENRHGVTTRIHANGAILFRGFMVDGHEDLQRLSDAFSPGHGEFDYSGGVSPRSRLNRNVYTSTQWTPILRLPLHNEMAYSKEFPTTIMFHCERPAKFFGRTPLADSRKVYGLIPKPIRRKFETLGIRYRRYYFERNPRIEFLNRVAKSHKTWMEVFDTHCRDSVKASCENLGIEHKWQSDGGIVLTKTLPAIRTHPTTGELVWFNQAHAFNHYRENIGLLASILAGLVYRDESTFMHKAEFGDGSPIGRETVCALLDAYQKATVTFDWKAGDVLLLDNMLCAHGREPFLGSRSILTSLS
jgi:alpha-ketoglutarate-dependent taurine dioxygenase